MGPLPVDQKVYKYGVYGVQSSGAYEFLSVLEAKKCLPKCLPLSSFCLPFVFLNVAPSISESLASISTVLTPFERGVCLDLSYSEVTSIAIKVKECQSQTFVFLNVFLNVFLLSSFCLPFVFLFYPIEFPIPIPPPWNPNPGGLRVILMMGVSHLKYSSYLILFWWIFSRAFSSFIPLLPSTPFCWLYIYDNLRTLGAPALFDPVGSDILVHRVARLRVVKPEIPDRL